MRYKINYTDGDGNEDSFIIEGIDIVEVKEKVKKECAKRGLDQDKNNMFSEKVDAN